MTSIVFNNVSVEFAIYNANSRSIKKRILEVATGGQVGANPQGRIIIKALHDISFNFQDGDRIGLIGHNGAGKSTLLRLLSGVYRPTSGYASVNGKIGSLIDISLGIDPESTGRENIYLRAALLGLTRNEVNKYLDEIIEFSELGNFIDLPLHTYSSGMHLRLAFSISTMIRPQILIMDEWLSVGDESFKVKAEQRMVEIVKSTNILVVASHSRELIGNICNRVLWLEHGSIKMDDSPEKVLDAYHQLSIA